MFINSALFKILFLDVNELDAAYYVTSTRHHNAQGS